MTLSPAVITFILTCLLMGTVALVIVAIKQGDVSINNVAVVIFSVLTFLVIWKFVWVAYMVATCTDAPFYLHCGV